MVANLFEFCDYKNPFCKAFKECLLGPALSVHVCGTQSMMDSFKEDKRAENGFLHKPGPKCTLQQLQQEEAEKRVEIKFSAAGCNSTKHSQAF